MFNKMEVPVLGIVENMSYLELEDGSLRRLFGEGGGEQLAGMAGVPLLANIPIEERVRAGGDQGTPVVVTDPKSRSAQVLIGLAMSVAARMSMMNLE
jgi:ATP-binding protein involved in chromosome partitioning